MDVGANVISSKTMATLTDKTRRSFARKQKTSKSDEHFTPRNVIDAVLELYQNQIDFDSCSNDKENPNVPARNCWTKEDDGLAQVWEGNGYINPPFSLVKEFVKKLLSERTWSQVIFLCKADSRTRWYEWLMDNCNAFCIYRGYMKFGDSETSAMFSVVLFYFGWNPFGFMKVFSKLGWCFLGPVKNEQTNQN